jgi:hypothetical protein
MTDFNQPILSMAFVYTVVTCLATPTFAHLNTHTNKHSSQEHLDLDYVHSILAVIEKEQVLVSRRLEYLSIRL